MKKHYKNLLLKWSLPAFMLWGSTTLAQTSLNLGGTGNRVETAADFDVTNGFTIEYDVYLNTLQDFNGMVTKGCTNVGSPLDVYINGGGQMNVYYGNCNIIASGTSNYNFQAATWYHIAHTFDPNAQEGKLYVNGALTDTWYVGLGVGNGIGPMMIGDRADDATDANSKFDNVRIWSGVRTANDIYNYQHVCLIGNETNLEVLYNMEEGTGTALTDLAVGNGSQNGNILGSVTWDAGLVCGSITPAAALNFDNNTQNYITAPLTLSGTSGTWEAWINKADWADEHDDRLFGNGIDYTGNNSFYVSLHPAVGFHFRYGGGSDANNFYTASTLTQNLAANSWHHMAATWSFDGTNTNTMIYLDGALVGSNSGVLSIPVNASTFYIGGNPSNPFFGPGSMDEVRLWNRALCQGEIQNNMNAELPMPQTGLVAYYKFNQGILNANNSTVTTAADSSGNSNDGTLTNFALTGLTSNWVAPGAVTNGIYASPFTTPTISVSGDMQICAGATANLTANGADTYSWSTTDNTASIAVTPTANTSYTVSGISQGCVTNMVVTTVTVNALPIITAQSGNVKSCGDTPTSFSVSSVDASDTYQWYYVNTVSPFDGYIINGDYSEHNYTTNNMTIDSLTTDGYNGYAMYCVVTNTNNCIANSNNDTIKAYSLPIIAVTSGTISCNGGVTTVTVTANGGTPAYLGTGTFTIVANSYTYTVTDANLCSATTTISVTEPNAITTVLSPTLCAGSNIIVGPHTYSTAGTYTDVLTSANGCDSTVTTNLTVNHATAAFGSSAVTCLCPVIGFMDSSSTNLSDPIIAWNWTFAGGTPSSANVQTPGGITFSFGSHVVCLKITTQGGCTDSICKTVFESVTGIDQYSNAPIFTIYPNPAQNNFTIETNLAKKQTLNVFDVNGKLVLSQSISGTTNINTEALASGAYNISVISNYGIANKRLIIVK